MTPTPFTKPGCDCHGCVAYGEHQEGYQGFHIITLTHLPHGEAAECRCGWQAMQTHVGAAIFQHRAHVLRDTLAWQGAMLRAGA